MRIIIDLDEGSAQMECDADMTVEDALDAKYLLNEFLLAVSRSKLENKAIQSIIYDATKQIPNNK
jgi:hypothetical protein